MFLIDFIIGLMLGASISLFLYAIIFTTKQAGENMKGVRKWF